MSLFRVGALRSLVCVPLIRAHTVTDIAYYREVDQSHLHLVPAQSSMRRFLIRLKERERREERLLRLRIADEGRSGQQVEATDDKEVSKPVVVANYIERSPTDILRTISSQIGRDFTAPDYRFHDDPYLIPYSSGRKRDYILSKDGGRRTARFVLDNHPEFFEKNLIEAQPPIKAFMPKVKFEESKASPELLRMYMAGYNVTDAIQVYRALVKKGTQIEIEEKQRLLELIAFFNESEATEEDLNITVGVPMIEEKRWKNGGLAEEIYSKMDPITPEARVAILCGMAKYGQFERAWQIFLECKANGVKMNVKGFNAAICSVPHQEGLSKTWLSIIGLLQEMSDAKCQPDLGTLLAVLKILRVTSNKEYSQSCELALSTIAEFNAAGIQMSLGVYKILIQIYCKRTNRSSIIYDILEKISDGDWSVVLDEEDIKFFGVAMNIANQMRDLRLAYKVHEILVRGRNDTMLSDFGDNLNYYRNFLYLVMQRESIDVTMEYINRFTPNIFSPTADFYKNLIHEIKVQGGYQHLPKLWVDLQLSQFAGVNKEARLELVQNFLEVVLSVDLKLHSDLPNLRANFLQVARDALKDVAREPDGRRLPLSQNTMAAPICDLAMLLALREDDFALAVDVMAFCRDEVVRIPGNLREETLDAFLREAIDREEKKAATDCVIYATELSLENASQLALTLTRSFELNETEKKQLNQFFAHDTKWQMLI